MCCSIDLMLNVFDFVRKKCRKITYRWHQDCLRFTGKDELAISSAWFM